MVPDMQEIMPRTVSKRHISLLLAMLIGLVFSVSARAQEEARRTGRAHGTRFGAAAVRD